jgi:hypothetical protein
LATTDTSFRPRRRVKLTVPSTRAKRV